jgi:(R,R)-butanediol dehydrogenase/meso-butanediol dehydrogenase/diacetyl reductase/L-iditol 2-dehydrogenase
MKAVFCTKVGELLDRDPKTRGAVDCVDAPEPEPGADEVKIKIAYCGICGSDPHTVAGIFKEPAPFPLGHEMSGVVVDVGPGAKTGGFKVGDRVSGNFRKVCGACYDCTNAQEQFCHVTGPPVGCMAEYVVWHEKQLVKLPDNVSLLQGSLLEPVSIAVRAMDKSNMKFGQNVLVSGGGPIGLLILQAINMFGAANLTLLEPNAQRRGLAKKYGAKYVFDPTKDDVKAQAEEITDGRGYDVIFEVSGVPAAASSMFDLAASLANILFVAQYPRDYHMPVNAYEQLYAKEVNVTGMFVSPYAFSRTARIIERFDLDAFTRAVYDIDACKEAFDTHMSGRHPKVIIRCNPDME